LTPCCPIVASEAVVIAASVIAGWELSIWLVAVAAAAGGYLGEETLSGVGWMPSCSVWTWRCWLPRRRRGAAAPAAAARRHLDA
jgi:hypothetical protein